MRSRSINPRWVGGILVVVMIGLGTGWGLRLGSSAGEVGSGSVSVASIGAAGGGAGDPNIVVILADDQDSGSLWAMPKLQRLLVRAGTSYENAYASLPQCCPSRATLLSGQYAHNHGVLDNDPPNGGYAAFDGSNALGGWLQTAGYRTGWVGKYLNGYGNPGRGQDPREVPPGWTRWVAPVRHTEYQMFGYTLNRDGDLRSYGNAARDYQTDVLAREAAAFVREGSDGSEPFFLTVSPLAPHQEGGPLDDRPNAPRNPRPAPRDRGRFSSEPLPRPPSFNELDASDKTAAVSEHKTLDRSATERLQTLYRSRLESLQAVDDLVARLHVALKRSGELEDTLIIYTSDQGFMLGEHRLTGKNRLYEEAISVPLVIRGPGIPANRSSAALVGNIDLAPTILDAAGAEPGLEQDGRSILPDPDSGAEPEPRPLLLEIYQGGRFAGVRSERYAYLDFGENGVELYDLGADPFQLHNRAGEASLAAVEARHARLLTGLRRCSGPGCG